MSEGEATASAPRALKLFEFESSGYYAAEDREAAFQLVMKNLHYDRDEVEEEFCRDVPDDEVIKVTSEESWGHPAELEEARPYYDRTLTVYTLELTAAEHAKLAPKWGYCFGGEQ